MKKTILIVISIVVTSCNSSNIDIDKKIIKELAEVDFTIPSVHGFLLLFISGENGKKACTNINVLHAVFLKYYSETYHDFESFLSDALTQKVEFSQKKLGENTAFFKINDVITNKYVHSKISDFILEYADKADGNKFVVKHRYNNDEYLYSILYYCFVNNYQISLDDYMGKYFITKKF